MASENTTYETASGSIIEISDEDPASPADIYLEAGEFGASLTTAEVYEFIVVLAKRSGLLIGAPFDQRHVLISAPIGAAGFDKLTETKENES